MPEAIDSSLLHKTWVHSHEEDADGLTVYRTPAFAFPPSRGRAVFTLRPDGGAETGHPGADDRTSRSGGRWELEGDLLRLLTPERAEVMQIDRVGPDVLVVRRAGEEQ